MRSCELSQPSRALYMTFLSAATMELRDAHPRARCINGHGNLHQPHVLGHERVAGSCAHSAFTRSGADRAGDPG